MLHHVVKKLLLIDKKTAHIQFLMKKIPFWENKSYPFLSSNPHVSLSLLPFSILDHKLGFILE